MSECTCSYSKLKKEKEFCERMIEGYKANSEKPWVYVPQNPATFGHLVVVSGKCYTDISDDRLAEDTEHLREIMALVSMLASKMKKSLELNGNKCEKVYAVTQCETPNLHFHFHLIPRFKGDKIGHIFLFEKELEEARWMLENDKKDDKIRDGCCRIMITEGILNGHKSLIWSDEWARLDEDRKRFIQEIKAKIEEILMRNLTI